MSSSAMEPRCRESVNKTGIETSVATTLASKTSVGPHVHLEPADAIASVLPTQSLVNHPMCTLLEHKKRRRGPCSACRGCRFCPMSTPECRADHIGKVNPTKRAESRKRKRRQSGGTPERDAERNDVLQKIQGCLRSLGCDDENLLVEWPALKKMRREVLDNAATEVVKRLVGLIDTVSGGEANPDADHSGMLRVVGPLPIAPDGGATFAESSRLTTSLTSLAVKGNAQTKRYMNSVFCHSLTVRRGQDILAVAGARMGVASTIPGEYAWASRRADYAMLNAGGTLEPALAYVRLKKVDFVTALEFIQNNCDLSWRNGHVVSRSIGAAKVEIPRLKRHLTMGFLFEEYIRWGSELGIRKIGRHEFFYLLRLVTVNVEEMTGASYYFTDGVIDTFKILTEMIGRLKRLEGERDLGPLEVRTRATQYFVKYELKAHLDSAVEGTPEGFHCVRHAVNGTCAHQHHWSCKTCSALDTLCEDMTALITEIKETNHEHSLELESMITCLKRVKGQMFRYVKHVARGMWQHARIADAIISVAKDPTTTNKVLFVGLDHKQKVLGRKLVESQVEYFGKVGMSLLGAMVMDPRSDAQETPADGGGVAVSLRFVDMITRNGAQDNFQVISCLEALIIQLHEEYPDVESIILLSDNASVFVSAELIPWIVKLTRKYPCVRISRYINTEAQTGRDMLDAHFSFLNRKIDAFVRKDNAVQTPDQLFDAITDQGGVANTTTLLLGVDSDVASHFNRSKRSFNTKVKSGVRKIHDTVYDQACGEIRHGATPMCRIFTNSGVPNSEMTRTIAEREANGRRPTIPPYVCASTFGEQVIASLVEKAITEPPHSTAPLKDEGGTLSGVIVLRKFVSTRSGSLRKTVSQALAPANATATTVTTTSSLEGVEAFRCAQCCKRYTSEDMLHQHQETCSEYVCRDKNELIASALTEFFTLSKQQFAETRSRSLSTCMSQFVVSEDRSRRNWAEKKSINPYGVLPAHIKNAIESFFAREREAGRKIRPQDASAFLMGSIVLPTDWDAKFLLSEQRLKTEISRLAK